MVDIKIFILLGLLGNIAFSQIRYYFARIISVGGNCDNEVLLHKIAHQSYCLMVGKLQSIHRKTTASLCNGIDLSKNLQLDSDGTSDVKKWVEKPSL